MKQKIFALMILGVSVLPATGQAGQYQQRVITTTTLIGATAGAVIGSSRNQTAEGAIVGGMLGAVTGILFSQNQPHPVIYQDDEYGEHAWRERQRRRAAHRRHEWREHEMREHRRFERIRMVRERQCHSVYGCPDYHYFQLQRAAYRHHAEGHRYED